jgi:hypothetical protein
MDTPAMKTVKRTIEYPPGRLKSTGVTATHGAWRALWMTALRAVATVEAPPWSRAEEVREHDMLI